MSLGLMHRNLWKALKFMGNHAEMLRFWILGLPYFKRIFN